MALPWRSLDWKYCQRGELDFVFVYSFTTLWNVSMKWERNKKYLSLVECKMSEMFLPSSRKDRPGYVVVPRGGREEGQNVKQRRSQWKEEETERGIAPRLVNDFWLLGECLLQNIQQINRQREQNYYLWKHIVVILEIKNLTKVKKKKKTKKKTWEIMRER